MIPPQLLTGALLVLFLLTQYIHQAFILEIFLTIPYTSSFYTYVDGNTDDPVTSIQQDLQKIFFPGIVTGSSAYGFGGKVFATGSSDSPSSVGSFITGSIGFQAPAGAIGALNFASIVSMSFARNSFNRVNFSTFLPTVNSNFRLIYRDLQSNAQAVYNVVNYNDQAIVEFSIFGYKVTHVSSTGSLILNNSSSVTFINTTNNQQTFYVVGVANPADGLPFAGQSTVGTADAGDFRSGIIKVYATESNNTSDWVSLIKTVYLGIIEQCWDTASSGPSSVAANHNLFMFTASAGNPGTASWELLARPSLIYRRIHSPSLLTNLIYRQLWCHQIWRRHSSFLS
jgi:hypothetical protein